MTTHERRWFHLGIWLLAGILLSFMLVRYSARGKEYEVYRLGAERMMVGESIYRPGYDAATDTLPFTYPPFFAFVFIPLASLPRGWQCPAWALVSFAALMGSFSLLRRCVTPGFQGSGRRSRSPIVFWALVAILCGRHVLSIPNWQSHDCLTLLLVMVCVASAVESRYVRSGVFAGLAAACKATPLLFAPALLWQRRWLAGGCVLLTFAAATLLPDLVTPSRDRSCWAMSWYRTFLTHVRPGEAVEQEGGWLKWSELNQSLSGTIYRLLNPPSSAEADQGQDVSFWHASPHVTHWITLAGQLLVLGVVLWAAWPRRDAETWPDHERRFDRFGQCALIVAAMPLLSPMSSKSHFAVVLVPVAYTLTENLYRRKDWLAIACLIASFIVGTLTARDILGPSAASYSLAYGAVTWCMLACFLSAARSLQVRRRALSAREPTGGMMERIQVEQRYPRARSDALGNRRTTVVEQA